MLAGGVDGVVHPAERVDGDGGAAPGLKARATPTRCHVCRADGAWRIRPAASGQGAIHHPPAFRTGLPIRH